jgi:hypothetical protein
VPDKIDAYPGWCLLWLAAAQACADVQGLRCCTSAGQPIAYGLLQKPGLEALLQRGAVRKAWIHCALEPWRLGVYLYEGGADAADQPYRRSAAPGTPLRLDALPERGREIVGRLRFSEADFARDTSFDPRRYVECIYGEDALRAGGPGGFTPPGGTAVEAVPRRGPTP